MLTMTAMPEVEIDRPPIDYPAGRDMGSDRSLPYATKAVYYYLAGKLGFSQFVTVKVWTTAHSLRMAREDVGLALRRLTEAGYLEAEPLPESRARAYRLVRERTRVIAA